MHWKTTAILLLATFGLGAYITFYEIKQPPPEQRAQIAKQLLSLPPDTVTHVTFEFPNIRATLERQGDAWALPSSRVRIASDLVDKLLEMLSPLTAERIFQATAAKPLEAKAYGLDPAVGRLTLRQKEGASTTLLFGERTPVGENRYVRIDGRPEIGVVPSRLFDESDQPLETFRDPRLLPFNAWAADEATVTFPTGSFSLTRKDTQWHVSSRPFAISVDAAAAPSAADRAERAEITSFLNRMSTMQIKRFVDDAPGVEQLSTWGFDHPRVEVRLRQQHSPGAITVFFGSALADDGSLVYAKRSDEPSLYAVAAADVDALVVDPHSLRQKACFEFFTSQVSKVEIGQAQTRWTMERSRAESDAAGAQWRVAETGAALDPQRVESFLGRLSDVRLGGFVDDAPSDLVRYGLQPPTGSIAIWTTDHPEPQRLLVGAALEGSTNRYGRIEGRTPVVRLPELITTLLATRPEPLQTSAPAAAQPVAPR